MQPVSVVVMDNLMGGHIDSLSSIYDLKGSTFNRISGDTQKGSVLKDLNFLANTQDRVRVRPDLQLELIQRIEMDKAFLNQNYLMDYSLLLLIFKKSTDKTGIKRTLSVFIKDDSKRGKYLDI